jgi:hypothetical protein
MKRTGWTASILFICVFALTGASGAIARTAAQAAEAEPIHSFYGAYEGESISVSDENLGKRDLAIAIVPRGKGFNLTWTTITYADGSSPVRKTYSIDFVPTGRANIYASAMRTDMFGNRVPLNPLEGDPFVWATLRGKTLSVYALMITSAGGYEMQTYHRTLTDQRLSLEFSRVRDGTPLRFITGMLVRVGH